MSPASLTPTSAPQSLALPLRRAAALRTLRGAREQAVGDDKNQAEAALRLAEADEMLGRQAEAHEATAEGQAWARLRSSRKEGGGDAVCELGADEARNLSRQADILRSEYASAILRYRNAEKCLEALPRHPAPRSARTGAAAAAAGMRSATQHPSLA